MTPINTLREGSTGYRAFQYIEHHGPTQSSVLSVKIDCDDAELAANLRFAVSLGLLRCADGVWSIGDGVPLAPALPPPIAPPPAPIRTHAVPAAVRELPVAAPKPVAAKVAKPHPPAPDSPVSPAAAPTEVEVPPAEVPKAVIEQLGRPLAAMADRIAEGQAPPAVDRVSDVPRRGKEAQAGAGGLHRSTRAIKAPPPPPGTTTLHKVQAGLRGDEPEEQAGAAQPPGTAITPTEQLRATERVLEGYGVDLARDGADAFAHLVEGIRHVPAPAPTEGWSREAAHARRVAMGPIEEVRPPAAPLRMVAAWCSDRTYVIEKGALRLDLSADEALELWEHLTACRVPLGSAAT